MARLSLLQPRGRLPSAALALLVVAVAVAVAVGVAGAVNGSPALVRAADRGEVRILAGQPSTFDPAASGDVASAAVTAPTSMPGPVRMAVISIASLRLRPRKISSS